MSDHTLTNEELDQVNGGAKMNELTVGCIFTTQVKSGYLALRSEPNNSTDSIIGQLWNGSTVIIQSEERQGNYVWVYCAYNAPGEWGGNAKGLYGYVDRRYLV